MDVRIEIRAPSSTDIAREIVKEPHAKTISLWDEKRLDKETSIRVVDWRLYEAITIPELLTASENKK